LKYSVVIPAYNEASCIYQSIKAIIAFLDASYDSSFEIIVVDDGSKDRTVDEALRAMREDGRVLVLPGGRNHGKGAAVRRGVLHSKGEKVLVTDADLSIPITQLPILNQSLDQGAGIVIGSRFSTTSAIIPGRQPLWRGSADALTQWIVRSVVPSLWEFADTQSGFKLLRGEVARSLCESQVLDGYGFDVEILYLAQRRGFRIAEVPVEWTWKRGSKVGITDLASTYKDILRVRIHSIVGKYDT